MTNYTKIQKAEQEIKSQTFESAVIFDGNGEYIVWVDGEKYSVDLQQFAGKMKGNILTHNHPSKNASSLSLNDVKYFISQGLQEVRAIDCKYTYSLVAKKEVANKEKAIADIIAKLNTVEKELNAILKASIINDTECFEDIMHEAWTLVFKGSRTFKYTRSVV